MPLIRPRPVRAALLAMAAVTATPGAVLLPLVAASPAHAFQPPNSFADLAAQLLPAVVNISSSNSSAHVAENDNGGGGGNGPEIPSFPPGSPFEQFFKDFMERNRRGQHGDNGDNGPAQPEHRM